MADHSYKLLLTETLLRLDLLKRKILKEKAKDFPSLSPLIFLTTLLEIVSIFKEELAKLHRDYIENHTVNLDLIISFSLYTRRLSYHLSFVEKTGSEHVPWSLIPPIEGIFRQFHKEHKFIVSAQPEFNYTYMELLSVYEELVGEIIAPDNLRNRLYERAKGELTDSQFTEAFFPKNKFYSRFGFIFFPAVERNSVFQHVLLGHEIGYNFFSLQNLINLIPTNLPLWRQKLLEALGYTQDDVQRDLQKDATYREKLEQMLGYLVTGLIELACDIFAVNTFGLAALFAFDSHLAGTESFDKIGSYGSKVLMYPPGRYRLRVICKLVKDSGVNERLKNQASSDRRLVTAVLRRLKHIEEVVADEQDRASIQSDPATSVAYEIIDSKIDDLFNVVSRTFPKDYPKGLDLDQSIVLKLANRLKDNIIPCEIYSCVEENFRDNLDINYRHIINAGWYHRIANIDLLDDMQEYIESMKIASRLILKAIELNETGTKWMTKNVPQ